MDKLRVKLITISKCPDIMLCKNCDSEKETALSVKLREKQVKKLSKRRKKNRVNLAAALKDK